MKHEDLVNPIWTSQGYQTVNGTPMILPFSPARLVMRDTFVPTRDDCSVKAARV
jgi:hypothetical protein